MPSFAPPAALLAPRVLARDPITPHFTRVALLRQSPVGRIIRVEAADSSPRLLLEQPCRCPTRGGASPSSHVSCLPRRARLTVSCPLGLARREQSQCSGTAAPICMWKSPAISPSHLPSAPPKKQPEPRVKACIHYAEAGACSVIEHRLSPLHPSPRAQPA